jgi:hypothetical protein
VAGHGIYIKFGALEDGAAEQKAVGQLIADALSRAGLKSQWNGDPETAVRVRLKWRKRRAD